MDTLPEFYRRFSENKRLIAGVLFITLVVGVLFAGVIPLLWPAAALAFLGAILSVICDTHRHVIDKRTCFESINDAWLVAKPEVEKALSRRSAEIFWLGVTLGDAWPRLSEVLRYKIHNGSASDVTIRLAQVHPDFLGEISQTLADRAENYWRAIEEFKLELSDGLRNNNITIVCNRYRYMPNYHGLLINRSRLFLSTVAWDKDTLLVAENHFELYDRTSNLGQHKLEVFLGWLRKSGILDDEG